MDLKPLPIAAALVGGGVLGIIASAAPVQKVSMYAPAGIAALVGLAALAAGKPSAATPLTALGFGGLAIAGVLAATAYQANRLLAQATHGNLAAGHMAGYQGNLMSIVGAYWLSQNVAPPYSGGLNAWARSQQENDMSGQRRHAAWNGRARP
jgi:hypothetical protein